MIARQGNETVLILQKPMGVQFEKGVWSTLDIGVDTVKCTLLIVMNKLPVLTSNETDKACKMRLYITKGWVNKALDMHKRQWKRDRSFQ